MLPPQPYSMMPTRSSLESAFTAASLTFFPRKTPSGASTEWTIRASAPRGICRFCGGSRRIGSASSRGEPIQPPAPKDSGPPIISSPPPLSCTYWRRSSCCCWLKPKVLWLKRTIASKALKSVRVAGAVAVVRSSTFTLAWVRAATKSSASSGLSAMTSTLPSPETNVTARLRLFCGRLSPTCRPSTTSGSKLTSKRCGPVDSALTGTLSTFCPARRSTIAESPSPSGSMSTGLPFMRIVSRPRVAAVA